MILTIVLKNHIEKIDFDDKLKNFNRKLLQRQQDMYRLNKINEPA